MLRSHLIHSVTSKRFGERSNRVRYGDLPTHHRARPCHQRRRAFSRLAFRRDREYGRRRPITPPAGLIRVLVHACIICIRRRPGPPDTWQWRNLFGKCVSAIVLVRTDARRLACFPTGLPHKLWRHVQLYDDGNFICAFRAGATNRYDPSAQFLCSISTFVALSKRMSMR
jgi:hypothetical protein